MLKSCYLAAMKLFARKRAPLPRPTETTHTVAGFEIVLPGDHQLPVFQRLYPLYDRFLPLLARAADDPAAGIVDIGANVGDTAIAMAASCRNHILAVEGDPGFFGHLQANIARHPRLGGRIAAVPAMVGTGALHGVLSRHEARDATSARLDQAAAGTPDFVTLDRLLVNRDDVALIKIDTDGFDWDVVASGPETLARHEPLLFWENYCVAETAGGYARLYDTLAAGGYAHVWIFDNFGNLLLADTDFSRLGEINAYLLAQERMGYAAFHYLDVLACTGRRLPTARAAIEAFHRLREPRPPTGQDAIR